MKIKIVNIFNILLSICAILFLFYAVWDWIPQSMIMDKTALILNKPSVNGASHNKIRIAKDFSDYSPIVENGLFAPVGKLIFIDTAISKDVLPNELNTVEEKTVALIGTIVGRSKKGYAIFEEVGTKKQDLFKETEQVFNAGTLNGVEKDKAYLIANGKKISFNMPMETIPEHSENSDITTKQKHDKINFSPVISQKVGERGWIIDQRAISKTLEDMGKVLTDGRLLPYKEGNKIMGFRISEVKPEGIFNLIGLKNGDILLKVNNYDIDSPEKGVQLLSGLKGESNISLDIIRDGQKMNMNYQIK